MDISAYNGIKLFGAACACNNDNITYFSVFAKPSCDNVLQPPQLRSMGCNTLSQEGLANVTIRKRMFYPLIENQCLVLFFEWPLKTGFTV